MEAGLATRLTAVHVNRILQRGRRDNLITLTQRRLTLLDIERLQEIAGFNEDYLHLSGAPTEAAATSRCANTTAAGSVSHRSGLTENTPG